MSENDLSIEAFVDRANDLVALAKSCGFPIVVAILNEDRIADQSEVVIRYGGGWVTALGMAQVACQRLCEVDRPR